MTLVKLTQIHLSHESPNHSLQVIRAASHAFVERSIDGLNRWLHFRLQQRHPCAQDTIVAPFPRGEAESGTRVYHGVDPDTWDITVLLEGIILPLGVSVRLLRIWTRGLYNQLVLRRLEDSQLVRRSTPLSRIRFRQNVLRFQCYRSYSEGVHPPVLGGCSRLFHRSRLGSDRYRSDPAIRK